MFFISGHSGVLVNARGNIERCQDIDQVLIHEIIFSSSEVLGKITSIRSKLPTAACWPGEEKRGNCGGRPRWMVVEICEVWPHHFCFKKSKRYQNRLPSALKKLVLPDHC